MDLRDITTLDRSAHWLSELIDACRRLGPLYTRNPQMVADLTRKAKALRTSLARFQEFLDAPKEETR